MWGWVLPAGRGMRVGFGGRSTGSQVAAGCGCGEQPGWRQPQVVSAVPGLVASFGSVAR